MKRLLLLLVAIVGMTLQSRAQLPFKVEAPKFQKFVKVIAKDVNLRQQPSASSPRLIFQSNLADDCMDCEPSLVWSNKPLRRGDEPARASILAVIGESGEWYHVHFYEEYYEPQEAYIMKKFCADMSLRPLSRADINKGNDGDVIQIKSGKYQGLCLMRCWGWYDATILRIGGYVDGMFVFPYCIEYSTDWKDSGKTKFGESYDDGEEILFFSDSLFSRNDEYQSDELDLEKLASNTQTLDLLMNNLNKCDKDGSIYFGIKGDSNLYVIQ